MAKAIKIFWIMLIVTLVTVVGLGACAKEEASGEKAGEYIHEGLATGDIGINAYSADLPGQSTLLPREYPGAPPLLPHSIEGPTPA